MEPDYWPKYADAVWREFTRRSGKPERLMSCLEWETMREWLDGGVPLRVVLRGIQDTGGRPNTLSYYRPSVRRAYEQWRQAVPL